MSQVNHDTAPVWQAWQRRELGICHCLTCGAWISLPKPFCPECWSDDVAVEPVGGIARLVTWSEPRTAPGAQAVTTGIASLTEAPGTRVLARLVGQDPQLAAGTVVTIDWREEPDGLRPQLRAGAGA